MQLNDKPKNAKPCLFCGHKRPSLWSSDDDWFMICSNDDCMAQGPRRIYLEEALDAWNRGSRRFHRNAPNLGGPIQWNPKWKNNK